MSPKEATKRLNVEVNLHFHQRLKMFAVQNNLTIAEIVIAALEEYMSKNSS
jgi:hypothetical protein